MNGGLKELIGPGHLEHYENWQEALIFESKRFSDPESENAQDVRHSISRKQAELASALKSGRMKASEYLTETALGMDNDGRERALCRVPKLPGPLTIGEMRDLPAHAERAIARELHPSLTPAEAAEPALWALFHAVWIHREMFDRNLEAVFFDGPRANTPEARTRNFLRRTGGLRGVRGNTSPLVDCPVSAAWWRYRLVLEIEEIAGDEEDITTEEIHDILRISGVWSNLVTMSLRKLTALCAPRARSAVVIALHCTGLSTSSKRVQIQGACHALGRLSYGHNLWYVPWKSLVDAARVGIEKAGNNDLDMESDPQDSQDGP